MNTKKSLHIRVLFLWLCHGVLICIAARGHVACGQAEQNDRPGLQQDGVASALLNTESRIRISSYSLYGKVYRRFSEDLRLTDEQQQVSDVLFDDYYHSLFDAAEQLDIQYRQSEEGLSDLFVRDMYADIEIGSPEFEALSRIEQGKVRIRHRMAKNPDYEPPLSFAAPGYSEARNAMIVEHDEKARNAERRLRQVFLDYIVMLLSDLQQQRFPVAVRAIDVHAACLYEWQLDPEKIPITKAHLDIRGLVEDASVEGGELSALYPIWPPRPDADEAILKAQLRLDCILIDYVSQYADLLPRPLDLDTISLMIYGRESEKDRAINDDVRLRRARFNLWDATSREIESLLNESQGPDSARRWKKRFLDAMYPGIPEEGVPTLMYQWLLDQELEPAQIAAIEDIHRLYLITRHPLLERSRVARRDTVQTWMKRQMAKPHPEHTTLKSVWASRTALGDRTIQSFRELLESSLQPAFDARLDEITQLRKSSCINPN